MRKIATKITVAAAAIIVLAAAGVWAGRHRFRSRVTGEVRTLFLASRSRIGPEQLRARLETLPAPVQRYLRYAIHDGAPAVGAVRLRHGGLFRTSPDQGWWPVTGEQYFTVAQPGFIWSATVRPIPVAWIEARDLLNAGRGNMLVKALSTVTLAHAQGPEIDQGAALRWLAECVWFPYAYANDAVTWEPVDTRSAQATLRQPGLSVSAVFEMDDDGRITRIRAQRYRDVGGGKAVLTPWTGTYDDYHEINGLRVPMSVEVAWLLETGAFSYARFSVTTIQYDIREAF